METTLQIKRWPMRLAISGNVALGVIILIISIVLGSFGTIKMFELNDLRFYKR
ncbi:MAG: hypothetical protein ACRDCB_12250 [Clostridium sp.]